jgi:hypothetical protein
LDEHDDATSSKSADVYRSGRLNFRNASSWLLSTFLPTSSEQVLDCWSCADRRSSALARAYTLLLLPDDEDELEEGVEMLEAEEVVGVMGGVGR